MRKRIEIDQDYYNLVKSRAEGKPTPKATNPENPYEKTGIYKDLEKYRPKLVFEERGNELYIKPKMFLGTDVWSKITKIVQKHDGDWVSQGRGDKNAKWIVPL